MTRFAAPANVAQSFLIIAAAYVFCHGLTALLVTPVQQTFLSEITVFASLVYLPHGVRVLATWLWGWKAVFPLFLGAFVSELLFTPTQIQAFTEPVLLQSIAVGALSAPIAFGLFRLAGRNLYAGQSRRMNWKWLLLVGAVASIINSVGQSYVYSGLIVPEDAIAVLLTYAVGDLVGLMVSMLALMLIFRWIRVLKRVD